MEKMKEILKLLPEGWEEAAKEKKALQRGRNIGTAEELLRLNFLYQTAGETYGLTAALTQISENQKELNKTAVRKRIINSAEWLKWMCQHLCLQEGWIVEAPKWLEKYRVCVVDASDYAIPGSRQADFRFHYMMELFSLNMLEMQFTEASQGETLKNFQKVQENDLIIADRAYGTISGMKHILSKKGDFVFRLRAKAFHLYTEDHQIFDLTEVLRKGNLEELDKQRLYFKSGSKKDEQIPIRICACRKPEQDLEKMQQQICQSNNGRKPASDQQMIWNQYTVIVTTLPMEVTSEQILELYRMRWQIELVFKRFKSIFHARQFRMKKKEAIEAWFYGKLLIAILCEILAKKALFPQATKTI